MGCRETRALKKKLLRLVMAENFRDAMTEWVELKKQLAAARKDLGILNKREKELRVFIKTHMKEEEIDVVKVDKQKVSFKERVTKGPITRDVIKKGLHTFFGGNEAQTEGAFQAILDAAPQVTRESISLTGKD
ncbi:hypothetical protein EBT31_03205 [bacterium]|nr:hypothetical protein [bacterium]NBX50674.1 hypothetical protein [bacterium]